MVEAAKKGPAKFTYYQSYWQNYLKPKEDEAKATGVGITIWQAYCSICNPKKEWNGKVCSKEGQSEDIWHCRVCKKWLCRPHMEADTCRTPEEIAEEKRLQKEAEERERQERERKEAEERKRQEEERRRLAEEKRRQDEEKRKQMQQQQAANDAFQAKLKKAKDFQVSYDPIDPSDWKVAIMRNLRKVRSLVHGKFNLCLCKHERKILRYTFAECSKDYPEKVQNNGIVVSTCGLSKESADKIHLKATADVDIPSSICLKCHQISCLRCVYLAYQEISYYIGYQNRNQTKLEVPEMDDHRKHFGFNDCCQDQCEWIQTFVGDKNDEEAYKSLKNFESGKFYCEMRGHPECDVLRPYVEGLYFYYCPDRDLLYCPHCFKNYKKSDGSIPCRPCGEDSEYLRACLAYKTSDHDEYWQEPVNKHALKINYEQAYEKFKSKIEFFYKTLDCKSCQINNSKISLFSNQIDPYIEQKGQGDVKKIDYGIFGQIIKEDNKEYFYIFRENEDEEEEEEEEKVNQVQLMQELYNLCEQQRNMIPSEGTYSCKYCGSSFCESCFWQGKGIATAKERNDALEKRQFKKDYDEYYNVTLKNMTKEKADKHQANFISNHECDYPTYLAKGRAFLREIEPITNLFGVCSCIVEYIPIQVEKNPKEYAEDRKEVRSVCGLRDKQNDHVHLQLFDIEKGKYQECAKCKNVYCNTCVSAVLFDLRLRGPENYDELFEKKVEYVKNRCCSKYAVWIHNPQYLTEREEAKVPKEIVKEIDYGVDPWCRKGYRKKVPVKGKAQPKEYRCQGADPKSFYKGTVFLCENTECLKVTCGTCAYSDTVQKGTYTDDDDEEIIIVENGNLIKCPYCLQGSVQKLETTDIEVIKRSLAKLKGIEVSEPVPVQEKIKYQRPLSERCHHCVEKKVTFDNAGVYHCRRCETNICHGNFWSGFRL